MKLDIAPQDRRDPVKMDLSIPAELFDRLDCAANGLRNPITGEASTWRYVVEALLNKYLPPVETKQTKKEKPEKPAKADRQKGVAA